MRSLLSVLATLGLCFLVIGSCEDKAPSGPTEIQLIGKPEVSHEAATGTFIGTLLMNSTVPTGAPVYVLVSNNADTFAIVKDSLRVGKVTPNYNTHAQHQVRIMGRYNEYRLENTFTISVSKPPSSGGTPPPTPPPANTDLLNDYLGTSTRTDIKGKYVHFKKSGQTMTATEVTGPALYGLKLEGAVLSIAAANANDGADFKTHHYNDNGPSTITFNLVCRIRIDKATVDGETQQALIGKTLTWYIQKINANAFWKYDYKVTNKKVTTTKQRHLFNR